MISILNKNFVYVNAAQTDVTKIWRKYGWRSRDEVLHKLPNTSNKDQGEILLVGKDKKVEMQALHKNNI